jgi:hypothetical protein
MFKKLIQKLRNRSKYAFKSGWGNVATPLSQLAVDISSPGPNQIIQWSNGTVGFSPDMPLDNRIDKKPVEVYREIVSEIPKINLSDLDGQIKLVRKRLNMFSELGLSAGDEKEALIYLNARKKLSKVVTKFAWATTNQKLIERLCSIYKLRIVIFDSYYKNVPMEAVDELEKFLDAWVLVRKDKPQFKLIIDEGGKETKKDPILLAPSPFGKWYYILGAWDKEVEIVDDLIYNGK